MGRIELLILGLVNKLNYYKKVAVNMYIKKNTFLNYKPEYIALELTNVCNFTCSFCPQSNPNHHEIVPKSYLSEEACRLYLSKIRNAGITTNLMHWTQDGEPFLNTKFPNIVAISKDFGFNNTFFATNGTYCNIKTLSKFPLDEVRLNLAIDFCADKNYFEKIRGTSGSWDRVEKNIRDILETRKTKNVGIVLTDISSFEEQDKKVILDNLSNMKKLFGKSKNLVYRTRTFHNATGSISPIFGKNKSLRYNLCPYPWSHFRITSSGDVVICCRDLDRKTVIGNLNYQSVDEIWNGKEMLYVRESLLNQSPNSVSACSGCDLPYDNAKFSLRNIYRAALGRMQIFG